MENIQDYLIGLKKNGQLPSREEILGKFRFSEHLHKTSEWFKNCDTFLAAVRGMTLGYYDIKKYPFLSILYSHVTRIQRYMLGLSCLSWIDRKQSPPIIRHAIDSYPPILKSIFELIVEFRLAFAFRNEFGSQKNWEHKLIDRVTGYADLTILQSNYKFWYIDTPNIPEELLPEDLRQYKKLGREKAEKDLKNLASKRFDGALFKDIKHWFPDKNRMGQKIGKRAIGSMQWRCMDVLSEYDKNDIPYFWGTAYHTIYDTLNRYSHPALGYEDNLLPLNERLFALFDIQVRLILIITKYFFDSILSEFNLNIESNKIMSDSYDSMKKLEQDIFPAFSILGMGVTMQKLKK